MDLARLGLPTLTLGPGILLADKPRSRGCFHLKRDIRAVLFASLPSRRERLTIRSRRRYVVSRLASLARRSCTEAPKEQGNAVIRHHRAADGLTASCLELVLGRGRSVVIADGLCFGPAETGPDGTGAERLGLALGWMGPRY